MYRTCLFCGARLGENDVLEHFPVGLRVAFDAARGRLWAVCLACAQWNLAPLEDRWEAVEMCERLFEGTRLRASTDNVGLARHRSGFELVRIGKPLRPELAAWRYGPRLARRRRQHVVLAGFGTAVGGAVLVGGAIAGPVAYFVLSWAWERVQRKNAQRVIAMAETSAGVPITLRATELGRALIVRSDRFPEGWGLRVDDSWLSLELEGSEARRVAGLVLATLNSRGATADQLRAAADRLDRAGDPANAFIRAVGSGASDEIPLWTLIDEEALALEMATHEESERRALEGELASLEAAWRTAEEVAAIADNLVLPPGVHQMLTRLTGGTAPSG